MNAKFVSQLSLKFVAALAFAAALVGCSGGDTNSDAGTDTPTTSVVADDSPTTQASNTGSEAAQEDSSTGYEVSDPDELFPDVVGVEANSEGGDSWSFSVTLSSPYDSPDRYADAWRVVGPDGTVFGERILGHDHANEQPFTRSQSGIEIPADVDTVIVEGRDQISGWGGMTMEYRLPR